MKFADLFIGSVFRDYVDACTWVKTSATNADPLGGWATQIPVNDDVGKFDDYEPVRLLEVPA